MNIWGNGTSALYLHAYYFWHALYLIYMELSYLQKLQIKPGKSVAIRFTHYHMIFTQLHGSFSAAAVLFTQIDSRRFMSNSISVYNGLVMGSIIDWVPEAIFSRSIAYAIQQARFQAEQIGVQYRRRNRPPRSRRSQCRIYHLVQYHVPSARLEDNGADARCRISRIQHVPSNLLRVRMLHLLVTEHIL